MAIYPPPLENPPIFNEIDFQREVDQQHLDQNYLRLVAQTEEDMNGNEIKNLGPATSGSGAARLDQVTGSGAFLPLTGGSMAGVIDMNQSNIDMYATGGGTGGGDIEMRNGQINACNSLNATSVVASGAITSGSLTSTAAVTAGSLTATDLTNNLTIGGLTYTMPTAVSAGLGAVLTQNDPAINTLTWETGHLSDDLPLTGGTMDVGNSGLNMNGGNINMTAGNILTDGGGLNLALGATPQGDITGADNITAQTSITSNGQLSVVGQNIKLGNVDYIFPPTYKAANAVLTDTDGAGTLDWVVGATSADLPLAGGTMNAGAAITFADNVDIPGAANGRIRIGNVAGVTAQGPGAVAIGNDAGNNTQAQNAVAIGWKSGETTQSNFSVAIGSEAGTTNQGNGGGAGIAIGKQAGGNSQGAESIAIGIEAGEVFQGIASVALGFEAGTFNQGTFAVAIGVRAGQVGQGNHSIAIGDLAGVTNQGANTIVLNATGLNSDGWSTPGGGTNGPTSPDRTYIAPIQQQATLDSGYKMLCYNLNTKEVRYMAWGSFPNTGAASKTFCIDHPVKEGYKLLHSCVESPQIDLNYRGKIKLKDGYGEVNIDEKFKMENGTFEALCRDIQVFTSNETGWTPVRGKMEGNILKIESAPNGTTDDDTISWLVIGERKDKSLLSDIKTDNEGKLITEQNYSTAKDWKSNC